jgi:hypothetical protein
VSRTARAHGRGNAPRLHARRGDVLQPFFYRRTSRRGDGRTTSSMGTGTRATLRPWRTKGKLTQTRHICRAQPQYANRRALRRPIRESAKFYNTKGEP